MKVSELISILQSLEQDRNIYLGYDRYELKEPDVLIFEDSDLADFHVDENPPYFQYISGIPVVGDYFFDAY